MPPEKPPPQSRKPLSPGSAGVLALCILVSQLAGVVGSLFTIQAIPAWYSSLQKPFFTPPPWVFAPVWLALYTLMGIALWLVWRSPGKRKRRPYLLFGVQLALNALWSVLFFGFRAIFPSLLEIAALWIALSFTLSEFWKVSRTAGVFFIPSLAWVTIALLLNLGIWLLNPA